MSDVQVIKANSNRINRKTSKVIERIRVAAYCRVSTDSEEQLTSYNSQVLHYKNLVESNPEWDLVDIFADEGISGTQTDKRVEFQRMINEAMEGKIDLIITKSISRFARNTLDTLKYVRMLKDNNVAIMFEKENINTLTMNGEMLLVILSSLAQQESESLSANVKMGLKMKMKRGELIGFHGCLGYDYNPIDKTLSINEEEAKIVRYIFQRYIEGAGAFIIAKELTRLNYKTKKGNTTWNEGSIRRIVKNEKYKGDILLGKTFTVDPLTHRRLANMGEEEQYYKNNNHEPIISEEMFEEAQRLINIRNGKLNNKGRGEKYSRKYAFSSIIKCGFCGGTAVRRSWHSNSIHGKYVWSCMTSVKQGRKYCQHSKGLDEKEIEKAFVDSFNILCSDNRDIVDEFLKDMEQTLSNMDVSKELKKVEKEISTIENKLIKLVDMRVDDTIDKDTYESKYIEFKNQMEKLKNDQTVLISSLTEKKDFKNRMKAFREIYEKNKPLKEFDRKIFESVVDKIILGKTYENGENNPYSVTFIFKTGFETEEKCKTKKNKSEDEKMCSYTEDDTCGVCSIDIKDKRLKFSKALFCNY